MGDGVKKPSPSEAKNKPIARKSIVGKKPIKKGELFSEDNLTVKRPGTGIWRGIVVLGKTADSEYELGNLIQ